MRRVSSTPDGFLSKALSNNATTSGIPEDTDLTMSSDDSAQVYQPPAHIAARFYNRPASSRTTRRSSAASSRRNSISSAHSHHSHHSHHSLHGPQSGHIAQHLRRASIIESRKARLADRAAHAEKVRLRAAMAKATVRTSNCEERAVAAQQARERYLAQVTAACAEEVKRAKRVAEDTKEKKEAEGRKLRIEMEEKLAEAEKRRVEYKRYGTKRGRGLSMPQIEEKKTITLARSRVTNESEAAIRIQHAWRDWRRRQIVEEFSSLGLTTERVRETSFDDVGVLLSQERVLTSTAKILTLCGLQDGYGSGATVDERAAVRTFLSAFLILCHPAHVLSNDGEQEQDLITKSREVLIVFERVLTRFSPSNQYTPPASHISALSEAYRTFVSAFTAWKSHDSSTLVQTMIAQYVELDLIWQKIKNETEEVVKADYRDGIRNNQVLLMVRIKRLAGPEKAKAMMRDAIRWARRNRTNQPQPADARPRAVVDSIPASGPAPTPTPTSRTLGSSTLTPPSNTITSDNDVVHTPSTVLVESQLSDLPTSVSSSPFQPSSSSLTPAEQDASDLAQVMSPLPTNRVLVHELAINKEYRIDAIGGPKAHLRKRLTETVFQKMRIDVEAGHGEKWIVDLVHTSQQRLLRLLPPGASLHTLIREALDPAVIAREYSMGSFSYERLFSFMHSILPRICAPFRDADVRALAEDQSGDVIDRLARLMHIIDLLSLDYANYILHRSAPRLIEEAPGYESRKFAEDLKSNTITLEKTQQWWDIARAKLFAEASRRDVERVTLPSNRPTHEKIYFTALTDLAITPCSFLPEDLLPETLHLDRERLLRIREDTLRITTIGAILLTAKNLLKRDVRQQWKPEAAKLWDLLPLSRSYSLPTLPAQIVSTIESSHALPAATRTHLAGAIARSLSQAATSELSDPVTRLLSHRLRAHVLARLSASSAGERVRVASTASEGLAGVGLPEFVARVGAMVEELGRMGQVDRASHGVWYDHIAKVASKTEGEQ